MKRNINRYTTDPVSFIDRLVKKSELGKPFRLMPHQREILRLAFQFDADGRLPWDTIIYSCPKKSGKTTENAALTLWWALTQESDNEILICANDFDQAQARVFKTITRLLKRNPELRRGASIQSDKIILDNGTTIQAIASEYAGAAGSNHGLTSWDELWGYVSESSRRLYEELSPVPTRKNSIRLITSYAGWENESDLLMGLYKQGVGKEEHPEGQGERIHQELPIYANREARLFVYWDHEPRMPWQAQAYYRTQKRTLRPGTYLRLHENRWATAEEKFILPEQWDACIDHKLSPMLSNHDYPLFVGVDASTKHDSSAVVACRWDDKGEKIIVGNHRIWKPTPREPLDLEATVEAYLRELCQRFSVVEILADPYQLHRSITTLQSAGLPIKEFPQSTANTTLMGQILFDLLNGKNLVVYPSDELRQHALNAVAIESVRGFRLAKEKASQKIDAIVALSMACVAAIQHGKPSTEGIESFARPPEDDPFIQFVDSGGGRDPTLAEQLDRLQHRGGGRDDPFSAW